MEAGIFILLILLVAPVKVNMTTTELLRIAQFGNHTLFSHKQYCSKINLGMRGRL
ncbi:hypothetical protein YC2023_037583 [Brassica napus]